MHAEFAADGVSAFGGLDGIDIANDVRDRHIGRREFLNIPLFPAAISDGRAVAHLFDQVAALTANGREWIIVDLTSGDDRDGIVQKLDQTAQNAALRLTSQSKQDHVMPGEDGVYNLRNDAVVVADDAREDRGLRAQLAYQVGPHFLFDGSISIGPLAKRTRSQFTES